MSIQRVSSKWTKTVVLQRSRTVNEYIPVTRQYDRQTLERMTELFELNYIKPDHGTYGNGVMRVKQSTLSVNLQPLITPMQRRTLLTIPPLPNPTHRIWRLPHSRLQPMSSNMARNRSFIRLLMSSIKLWKSEFRDTFTLFSRASLSSNTKICHLTYACSRKRT